MPNKILTIELREGEKIKNIIRQTPLVILPCLFLVGVFYIILFFFLFTLIALGLIGIIIFIFLFFLGFYFIGGKLFKWYMNVFIVTSERIIDLELKNFINKSISVIAIKKVDNIHYRVKGIFQTLFRCGDIFIQSHRGVTYLMMPNVRKPARVQTFLLDLIDELKQD